MASAGPFPPRAFCDAPHDSSTNGRARNAPLLGSAQCPQAEAEQDKRSPSGRPRGAAPSAASHPADGLVLLQARHGSVNYPFNGGENLRSRENTGAIQYAAVVLPALPARTRPRQPLPSGHRTQRTGGQAPAAHPPRDAGREPTSLLAESGDLQVQLRNASRGTVGLHHLPVQVLRATAEQRR